jgi:hypothetical protein
MKTVTLPRDQYSELLKKLENNQPVWEYALDKVRYAVSVDDNGCV